MLTCAAAAAECSGPIVAAAGGVTTPSFVGAGAGDMVNTAASLAPTYPSGIAAGDLFVAVGSAYGSGLTAPAGWTLQAGPDTVAGVLNTYVWTRDTRATGSESGAVAFTADGGERASVRIYAFRNVATSSFIESLAVSNSTSGTVTNPTVTPLGTGRLGVMSWHGYSDAAPSAVIAVGSAASGGTWSEQAEYEAAADIFYLELQTADLSGGGAISGGTTTVAGSNRSVVHSFALVHA